MRDLGLLIMRMTTGSLLMGHGSQKLFGWYGGYGLEGTGGWLESLGLRPGRQWAVVAGLSEFVSGLLTALGLFHPVGPLTIFGPMGVATGTAHAGKPIWVAEGGAELPVTNMAIGLGLTLAGPGRISLDRMLGIKVPAYLAVLWALAVALGIGVTLASKTAAQKQMEIAPPQEETEAALVEPQTQEAQEERGRSAA